MSETTTNIGIPLPGAEETSRRLTDIRIVKTAIVAIDGAIAGVAATAETKLSSDLLGAPNGIATLNANGLIPESQLPSFVDDVLEYPSTSAFPSIGESGKIYVSLDDSVTHRWSGSVYVAITSGAVDSVNGKNGLVVLTKADVGLGNVDNTSDAAKPVSAAQLSAIATAEGNAIAASAPVAHVGSGGGAHAVATTGANGFMSAADKVKVNNLSGINTGDQTNITGNAGTATKLATARNINGVPFDGTADITISGGGGGSSSLPNKQIGFGDANGLQTSSAKFTWDNVNNILFVGDGSGAATVMVPTGTVRSSLNLFGQDSPGGSSTLHGGDVNIRAGYGNSASNVAHGGSINLNAGIVQSFLGNGNGGSVNINAGTLNSWGTGLGGDVRINAGTAGAVNGAGGSVVITTGGNYKNTGGQTRGGSYQVWTTSGASNAAKTTTSRQFMIRDTGAWVLGPAGDEYSADGPGTAGQVLFSNGPSSAPYWGNVTVTTLPTLILTESLTAGNISIGGDSITSTGSTITIDPSGAGPSGLVVIAGDLQVTGTTTTIDSTTVTTAELNVTLAKDAINAAAADGAGISVAGANANFTYSATTDRWNLNKGLSVNTTLTIAGNNGRILADFSSALGLRTFLQTSTANSISSVGVLPSGSATTAIIGVHNSSDPANSSSLYLQASSTDNRIVSDKAGTGAYMPIAFHTSNIERFRIGINGEYGVNGANYGTAGQVLTSAGAGSAPSWQAPTAGAGNLSGTTLATNVVSSSLTSVGTLTSLTVSGAATVGGQPVGYLTVPQNAQGSYTLGLTDSGKHLYTDTGSVTWTIPANSVVAFPIGTAITFANGGAAASTIAITSDSMIQNKIGPKTSLTLAPYGLATAIKVSATKWMISGDLT